MPDNIYLISESYILYTILYLLIQDGRKKFKMAASRIENQDILVSGYHI